MTQALQIDDIRGGMDDQTPPHLLPDNKCVLAQNVEFWLSSIGERRRGCEGVDLTGSGLTAYEAIVHTNTFQPQDATLINSELWAIGASLATSTAGVARRVPAGTWSVVTLKDAIEVTLPDIFNIRSVSLHGKFFLAYQSAETRLHVYDPETSATVRRAGLAAPAAAPTVTDTGGAGTYTDPRTFRVRFIVKVGSVIELQSEPSPEIVFTPSGTNDGAIITRPALVNEGETHWVLEASDGDGNFYQIATIVIGTTTYTDTTQPATGYADEGVLSPDLGEYDLFPSVRFLGADEDRLIGAGDFDDPTHGSRICWSPVSASIGFGNDERLPTDTNNFIDLDWMDGGNLTGISRPNNGSFYAFKWLRIYKIQRTYTDVNEAYDSYLLTAANGAIYGSVVDGQDEYGRACTYCLDPQSGPMRISSGGLQYMRGLRTTWESIVNTDAQKITAHGVYYPDKQQVHWWVATDASDTPNYKIICQVNEVESGAGETSGGWSVATGDLTTAYCSTIVPERVVNVETGATSIAFRPYTGHPAPMYLQRNDVGSKDNGTKYKAKILSKPYLVATLINRWGAMMGSLLAKANPDRTVQVKVSFIRDFGKEQSPEQPITDFRPEGNESQVIKDFDALVMSEARAIQVQIEDP